MYTLYDVETQIPVFSHIAVASIQILRRWMKFLMNQAHIISLATVITTSRCYIRFIRLESASLSEQKRTFNTNPSNENVGYLQMCFRTQISFLRDFVSNNTIQSNLG